jgi:hypothetical protein|tara:strand:+ start:1028 stop:1207 length:180 start_codon:yes stop_codon:yes gene_type:complete
MIDGICVTPYTFPQEFNDLYNCQITGYQKAIEKIEEIGIDKINEFKIYTTFVCKPFDTI